MINMIMISTLILLLTQTSAYGLERPLSLKQFLEQVAANNPELKVEKANVMVSESRARGLRLAPPMAGLMKMSGMGARQGYEISQELPFPTKLVQDKKARELQFESQKQNFVLKQAAVLSKARLAFVNYWAAFKKAQLAQDKADWLNKHVRLASSTAWTDTSAKIHLLEVESEADTTESEVLSLKADVVEKRAALKALAPDLDLADVSPAEPPLSPIQVDQVQRSPEIDWRERELKARQADESLAKQSYLPDIVVRFRAYDGSAMFLETQELMVGLSLPFLYFWQPHTEATVASLERAKAEAELLKARVDFSAKLEALGQRAASVEAQLKTLHSKLIPRAEARIKLARNLSSRTLEGLDQHRAVVLSVVSLKMKAIDLRLDHELALSEVLQMTGKIGSP